ncbi:MAG: sulfatase-like hydrolase/transferase, partial [Acidobacteria bacterium]|nr:sulfatase-like hydrolase/transferase [Acidobacteriota bacterium]
MSENLRRRELLRLGALGGGALALGGRSGAAAKRPNILFLLADDQRFSTIRALNCPEIETPNLDSLAHRGVAFTHAYIMCGTQGAICAPSRAMLQTGRTLFRVPRSMVPNPYSSALADDAFTTFPETLRKAGYETFGIGKWHNLPPSFARSFSGGENIFFGGMSNHLQVPVRDFDPSGQYKTKPRIGEKFSSELFSDSAVKFLSRRTSGKPFCLYVAYTAPHDPRMAPQAFRARYSPSRIALPKNFLPMHPFDNGNLKGRDEALAPWPRTPEIVREHIAAYYAMITHLDEQIGHVIKALESSGEADNTIIVFSADNGLALGSHGLLGKQNVFEHSMRVPLMISGPGIPRGRSITA